MAKRKLRPGCHTLPPFESRQSFSRCSHTGDSKIFSEHRNDIRTTLPRSVLYFLVYEYCTLNHTSDFQLQVKTVPYRKGCARLCVTRFSIKTRLIPMLAITAADISWTVRFSTVTTVGPSGRDNICDKTSHDGCPSSSTSCP